MTLRPMAVPAQLGEAEAVLQRADLGQQQHQQDKRLDQHVRTLAAGGARAPCSTACCVTRQLLQLCYIGT